MNQTQRDSIWLDGKIGKNGKIIIKNIFTVGKKSNRYCTLFMYDARRELRFCIADFSFPNIANCEVEKSKSVVMD